MRAHRCFVTKCTSLLYIVYAHLGSWLQSARRHTLNTNPGALLNAARAFISCLNGWMERTEEPGRFAEEVSTCISVMKSNRNARFNGSRIANACKNLRRNVSRKIIVSSFLSSEIFSRSVIRSVLINP